MVLALLPFAGQQAQAAVGDIGTEDAPYVEATNPTVSKPQSKVWFQDGAWYAAMLKTGTPSSTGRANADFYIYKLTGGTWVPTATLLDNRGTTKLDVVVSGNNLYVASHKFIGTATGVAETTDSNKTKITKFTYDAGTKTYTKVVGFPKNMNDYEMESLTIDVDSTGAIWSSWAMANKVYWQRSTDGGNTWSAPAALTDAQATTSSDDVASLVAFGTQVGIMWSDQAVGHDGFWFATTAAGSGPVTWAAAEAAYTGIGVGDDHVNLKALNGDVYAAVKTRMDSGSKPLIEVMHRSSTGNWTRTTAYVGSTNTTRPVLELDATHQTAQLFVTGPEVAGGKGENGGAIYRKTAPLSTLAFGAGLGEKVMSRPGTGRINDTSGSKAPITDATGVTVIAADQVTLHYWHFSQGLTLTAPSAPNGVTVQAGAGKVMLKWGAATAGSAAIDHYRVTATPALPTIPDFPASATGTFQTITAPNDVSRVFHVQAVAAGTTGPAADSEPVTPGAYVPFLSTDTFTEQQAKDFLGRSATAAEKSSVHSSLVGGGKTAPDVIMGSLFYGANSVARPDGTGPQARISRLYFAYFLRSPDRSGYDYWLGQLTGGKSLERISKEFALSSEFVRTYGPLSNSDFVNLVYGNLFGRAPDAGGKTFWVNKLDGGFPRGTMMTQFSEGSEYRNKSLRKVQTVIVYRHMLQRLPTAAQLTTELAKASINVEISDILGSAEYKGRIIP
ncbi:DUF4214 domain-containing protein [Aquihabitans sp. McL0605]|uniref:DUF4214 domain-containing protein n=1 Tax=Aquihabitans sp. McL0605 TaxID=3415671 RepID=UPI003CF579A1